MKNKKFLLIIFVFSICMMIPTIITGYIKGHDTYFHVANISAIVEKLSWNNLTVQEPLKFIANNFGYGTRFFYPPIPHLSAAYITKFFTLFNINDVTLGMRITQWISILASGITFYYLSKKIFKNEKIATICSLVYMSVPYHLTEIFIRDAFSEMFIPVAIPLIILGLISLVQKNYKTFFICFIGGYTLAIYSHMAMTVYFTLILLVTFFTVYFKEIFNKKNILYLCIASILILLLTASFWMPMLEIKLKGSYGVFVPYFMTGKGDLRFSAISIFNLIDYTKPHNYDYIRFNLQFFIVVMIIISMIFFVKRKLWKEKIWIFILAFTALSAIMITPLFPWYYTPNILQTLQFPWRLVIYIDFGAILISGICLKQIEKNKCFNIIFIFLIIISLMSSYYYTNHLDEKVVDINNIDYSYGVGNQAEYLPEKTLKNMDYYNNRENEIITLSGTGKIKVILDDVPNLIFEVEDTSKITIELPRLYYMGYSLKMDWQEIKLEESDNGFLKTTLEKDGRYILTYEKTTIMRVANTLSVIAFVGLIAYLVIYYKREEYKIQK